MKCPNEKHRDFENTSIFKLDHVMLVPTVNYLYRQVFSLRLTFRYEALGIDELKGRHEHLHVLFGRVYYIIYYTVPSARIVARTSHFNLMRL